jgi:hypothetical protein
MMDYGKCRMVPCYERKIEKVDALKKPCTDNVSGYVWEDASKKRLLRFDSEKDSDPSYYRFLDDFEYSTLTHHVCAIKTCHIFLNCENSKKIFLQSCFSWLIGEERDPKFRGLDIHLSLQWFLRFRFFRLYVNVD